MEIKKPSHSVRGLNICTVIHLPSHNRKGIIMTIIITVNNWYILLYYKKLKTKKTVS